MEQFTKQHLLDLLYAIENIGGNAEPEEDSGIIYSQSALAMADQLFPRSEVIRAKMVESGYGQTIAQLTEFNPLNVTLDQEAVDAGFITAVKLWLECMEAPDPVKHAKEQTELGLEGERIGA